MVRPWYSGPCTKLGVVFMRSQSLGFSCLQFFHVQTKFTFSRIELVLNRWTYQCTLESSVTFNCKMHLGLRFSTVWVGHKDTSSLQPAFAHRNTTERSFSVHPLHIPTEIAHQRWPSHSNTIDAQQYIFTAFLLKLNLVKFDLISPLLVWILTALASASTSVLRCQRFLDTQIPQKWPQ